MDKQIISSVESFTTNDSGAMYSPEESHFFCFFSFIVLLRLVHCPISDVLLHVTGQKYPAYLSWVLRILAIALTILAAGYFWRLYSLGEQPKWSLKHLEK